MQPRPRERRVSEVNLCVNKWWAVSEKLVAAGIWGVRVKGFCRCTRAWSTSSFVAAETGLHISWALCPRFTCGPQANLTVLLQLKPHITGHCSCWWEQDKFQRDALRLAAFHSKLLLLPPDSRQRRVQSRFRSEDMKCCRSVVSGVFVFSSCNSFPPWLNNTVLTWNDSVNKKKIFPSRLYIVFDFYQCSCSTSHVLANQRCCSPALFNLKPNNVHLCRFTLSYHLLHIKMGHMRAHEVT